MILLMGRFFGRGAKVALFPYKCINYLMPHETVSASSCSRMVAPVCSLSASISYNAHDIFISLKNMLRIELFAGAN